MTDPIDILEATHITTEFAGLLDAPGVYVVELPGGNRLLRAVYSADICGDGEKCALFNAGCGE